MITARRKNVTSNKEEMTLSPIWIISVCPHWMDPVTCQMGRAHWHSSSFNTTALGPWLSRKRRVLLGKYAQRSVNMQSICTVVLRDVWVCPPTSSFVLFYYSISVSLCTRTSLRFFCESLWPLSWRETWSDLFLLLLFAQPLLMCLQSVHDNGLQITWIWTFY